MWKWMGLFLRKNYLWRCWSWFCLLNWIVALTLSLLLILPPRKLEPWFVLSPEVAVYFYKSTIQLCMEYCCHVWAGASGCSLELLDKPQQRICRTVGPSLAASLEPFAYRWNVAILSLSNRYYFGRCSSDLSQLVPLVRERGLLIILIDCMIILSSFLDVTRMSMSTVSFLAHLHSGVLCLQNALLWWSKWSKWL